MIYMKRLRMNKGITMKKLGELVGVSESAISQYENLKRRPEYETLLRLCEELGCSAPDLFRDESEISKRDDDYYDLIEELQLLRDREDLRGLLRASSRQKPSTVRKVQEMFEAMEEG